MFTGETGNYHSMSDQTPMKFSSVMHVERKGRKGAGIYAASLMGIVPTLYVTGGVILDLLPKFGLPPCEYPDMLAQATWWSVIVLLVASVWLLDRALRRPTYAALLGALLIPATTWGIREVGNQRNTVRQRQCAARPLGEAMRACRADPSVYRVGRDRHGFMALTLVEPGTTDDAWSCLNRWSIHNGKYDISVNDSVYEAYRKQHPIKR